MSKDNENQMSKDATTDDKELRKFYQGKKLVLLCHIMQDNQEIHTVKRKIYDTDFMWKNRLWPINRFALWTDRKGITHGHFDVNYADGAMYLRQLTPERKFIDKCVDCGHTIGIDAQNVRDLLKKKTISAYWGIDNSHIMLIMISMIAVLILVAVVFIIYGDNQKLQAQIIKQTAEQASGKTVATAKLLIGAYHVQ